MAIKYRRRKVDTEIEKDIITGLIVSDSFCRDLLPICRGSYFQTDLGKLLYGWVHAYYEEYSKAPGKDIKNIYLVERKSLEEEKGEVVEKFLTNLSEGYEQKEQINEEYLKDYSIRYIKERALTIKVDEIKANLELNNIEEAEKCVLDFNKITKATSNWIDPFDPSFINKVFEETESALFYFPGRLGKFLGPMKRKWLVSFMGPMKRGKTNWLVETMFTGLMSNLKCVFISLEMSEEEVAWLSYKKITAAQEDFSGNVKIPIFDCVKNQYDTCVLPERAWHTGILDENGRIKQWSPTLPYKPCTACRTTLPKEFDPTVWYMEEEKMELSPGLALSKAKGFSDIYGRRARFLSYPIGTANLDKIKADLDLLEFNEDFIPDVIIIDYADLLGSEDSRLTGRESINETWKAMKRLAQERKCLVMTATQSNRESMETKTVRTVHTGEDIRKIAHVNAMISLNQTDVEKRTKQMRLGIIVHRHKDFSENELSLVLQQIDIGQFYLDAETIWEKEDYNSR